MLLAVLFDASEEIIGIAPACDQHPLGERYWNDIYPAQISFHAGSQTAYVEVNDQYLLQRISLAPYDDAELQFCVTELERMLDSQQLAKLSYAA